MVVLTALSVICCALAGLCCGQQCSQEGHAARQGDCGGSVHAQHKFMCHGRAGLAGQGSWSMGRQQGREMHGEIDSSERESLCPGRAALGGEDALKINSPHAKEIVVAALTAAGKEAGLKVRSFHCMGAGLGRCRTWRNSWHMMAGHLILI